MAAPLEPPTGEVLWMTRKLRSRTRPAAFGWTPSGDFVPPGPASESLQAAARTVIADSVRVAARIEDEVRWLPVYCDITDRGLWGEIREVIRANLPVFLTSIVEGRKAGVREVGTAIHFARRRVRQGIPLRAHLRAHAVGAKIMWEELVENVAGRPDLQEELLHRALWAFQLLDAFSFTVAEAYAQAQEGHARYRDRLVRSLFDEIVLGDPESTAAIETCARLVDLDLAADFHAVVVRCPERRADVSFPAELSSAGVVVAVASAAGLTAEQVLSDHRKGEFLLLVPAPVPPEEVLRPKLEEALRPVAAVRLPVLAGVSGSVVGAAGTRQGFREASRAADFGELLHPERVVHFYEEHVLDDVLESAGEEGARLVEKTITPLVARGETGRRLVETLETYFRLGTNLKATAAALDVHRNTLGYRLRQIQELTGLDLSDSRQRLRLENALRLWCLQRMRSAAKAEDRQWLAPRAGKRKPPARAVRRSRREKRRTSR